jgi:undecaprenyl pyrophosphate phosphatase UppP
VEALTIAEALELIRINEEAMSTQFETWLTITFATIVSVFVGKRLLNRVIRWLITLLYALASLMVIAMALYFAESNAQLVFLLSNKGAEVEGPVFAGAVALTLFLAGVLTTFYFIHMDTDNTSN